MGKAFYKLGGNKRKKQLARWKDGPNSLWKFEVSESEVKRQLLKNWRVNASAASKSRNAAFANLLVTIDVHVLQMPHNDYGQMILCS